MELALQQTGQEIWQTCDHADPALLMGQDLIVVPDSSRERESLQWLVDFYHLCQV